MSERQTGPSDWQIEQYRRRSSESAAVVDRQIGRLATAIREQVSTMFNEMTRLGGEFADVDELAVRVVDDDLKSKDIIFVASSGRKPGYKIAIVKAGVPVSFNSPESLKDPSIKSRDYVSDAQAIRYGSMILHALATI